MVIPDNTSRPLPALLERRVPGDCRAEVRGILQEVYGYDDFRDLEIYDNLFEGNTIPELLGKVVFTLQLSWDESGDE